MAATDGIARIQRVNTVRKTRLIRALTQAQDASRTADAALHEAAKEKARQAEASSGAHQSFRANPASEQGRLWREICNERLTSAQAAEDDAAHSADLAKIEVHNEARAVRNHDIKASKIDDYAKERRRETARLREIRDEDELTPGARGRII